MTATLLPNGKQQFIDINGNPLVNGTVEFYVQATLVPKDTWKNSGQSILNTNPVVLDSRGQAIIYGNGVYRQIVKDPGGNVIWDQLTASNFSGTFGAEQTIASNTTTDLGSLSSNNALISGTTTIASFGTSALLSNPFYVVRFNSSLTLTYNGTSMILPNAVDITTHANDMAIVEFVNASGYWRLVGYFSANGTPLSITGPETSLASNTTTDLGSIASHLTKITSTNTIASLGSSASTGNPLYFVKFASALTLTYNATSLILPGSRDLSVDTNDFALFEYLGSGNWICLSYFDNSGLSGTLLQFDKYDSAGASTWSKPAGCRSIIVEVIGGGASGGGAGTSVNNHLMAGTGGGAGAFTKGRITSPAASYTVTVGAGGAAPTAGANDGNNGAASSLGTAIVAGGGFKGVHGADTVTRAYTGQGQYGSNGGTVTTAGNMLSANGSEGNYCSVWIDSGQGLALGGFGGPGPYGGQAIGGMVSSAGVAVDGEAGRGPGGGGGGGASWSSGAGTNARGGAGHDGYVIIYSYS